MWESLLAGMPKGLKHYMDEFGCDIIVILMIVNSYADFDKAEGKKEGYVEKDKS